MLVDAEGASGCRLGVGFSEELLALQHHGENIAGVFRMFLILFDKVTEQFLGALFGDGTGVLLLEGGGLKFRSP